MGKAKRMASALTQHLAVLKAIQTTAQADVVILRSEHSRWGVHIAKEPFNDAIFHSSNSESVHLLPAFFLSFP